MVCDASGILGISPNQNFGLDKDYFGHPLNPAFKSLEDSDVCLLFQSWEKPTDGDNKLRLSMFFPSPPGHILYGLVDTFYFNDAQGKIVSVLCQYYNCGDKDDVNYEASGIQGTPEPPLVTPAAAAWGSGFSVSGGKNKLVAMLPSNSWIRYYYGAVLDTPATPQKLTLLFNKDIIQLTYSSVVLFPVNTNALAQLLTGGPVQHPTRYHLHHHPSSIRINTEHSLYILVTSKRMLQILLTSDLQFFIILMFANSLMN